VHFVCVCRHMRVCRVCSTSNRRYEFVGFIEESSLDLFKYRIYEFVGHRKIP